MALSEILRCHRSSWLPDSGEGRVHVHLLEVSLELLRRFVLIFAAGVLIDAVLEADLLFVSTSHEVDLDVQSVFHRFRSLCIFGRAGHLVGVLRRKGLELVADLVEVNERVINVFDQFLDLLPLVVSLRDESVRVFHRFEVGLVLFRLRRPYHHSTVRGGSTLVEVRRLNLGEAVVYQLLRALFVEHAGCHLHLAAIQVGLAGEHRLVHDSNRRRVFSPAVGVQLRVKQLCVISPRGTHLLSIIRGSSRGLHPHVKI